MSQLPNSPTDDDPELTEFANAVEMHLGSPGVSMIQLRRGKIAALERFMSGRKIVYLDTKYWVYLRDPDDSPTPDVIHEIKRLLYAGVSSGKSICPMSVPMFMELQSQPIEWRSRTAKVMDDLSMGYCLSPPEDVYGIEISRFFIEHASSLRRFLYAIQPVWTKIGTLFEAYPPRGFTTPEREVAADKAILDKVWAASVSELAGLRKLPLRPRSVADQVNEERRQNPRNGRSFQNLYRDELHGILEFNKDVIDASVRDVTGLVLNPADIPESSFSTEMPARVFINLLREATTRGRGQPGIPMQRTEAALYAALRLNEQRPFNPNDAFDIRHTASALAYCDVYLTERFFAALTSSREIRSVAPLNCQVASNTSDALALIQALSA